MIATSVPVMIDADAAEQINKLALRTEFDSILEYLLQSVPNLTRVEVTLPPSYEEPNESVVIDSFGNWDGIQYKDIRDRYWRWVIDRFPPEASYYIHLSFCPVAENGSEAIP